MKIRSETIVFFGSGPVAAKSLQLLAQDFLIEAVITKPRAINHQGVVPVLDIAAKLNLPVFEVADKGSLDKVITEKTLQSRVAILIDFGIIVSQKVINHFPMGIINSHFSLLPEWRGADPITFSILSGQKQSGVSLMLLTAGLDEGPILAYSTQELPNSITTPELTEQLIELSYHQLRTILPLYLAGQVLAVPQDNSRPPTYSRKLSKKDGRLDWNKPAYILEREIRAFTGWPRSYTTFGTLEVVIIKAHVANVQGKSGTRTIVDKKPAVYCREKALVIDSLKPAGKKEMPGDAFLAGYKTIFLE